MASKGLVRQEGFHPETPSSSSDSSMAWRPSSALGGLSPSLSDGLGSGGLGGEGRDFEDLASLMSSERSTAGNGNSNNGGGGGGGGGDYVPRTHNIFDMGAPAHQPQHSMMDSPSSLPSAIPAHFNSTLPALNSSMRYEPLPDPSGSDGGWRHSPSPMPSGQGTTPTTANGGHPYAGPGVSRSRSRSRPPSAYPGPASPGIGSMGPGLGVGPQRTTRTRRGNSVSSLTSTSPPPHGQAIAIPRNNASSAGGGADGWFGPGSQGSLGSSAGEYTLPTPESMHSHSHPHSHHHHHPGHSHSPASFHLANLSLNVSNLGGGPLSTMNSLSSPLNQFMGGPGGGPGGGGGPGSPMGAYGNGGGGSFGHNNQWPSSPGSATDHHFGSPFDTHGHHAHAHGMHGGFGGGPGSGGGGGGGGGGAGGAHTPTPASYTGSSGLDGWMGGGPGGGGGGGFESHHQRTHQGGLTPLSSSLPTTTLPPPPPSSSVVGGGVGGRMRIRLVGGVLGRGEEEGRGRGLRRGGRIRLLLLGLIRWIKVLLGYLRLLRCPRRWEGLLCLVRWGV
ncbi:hypothetical protein GYMLUDRAFT_697158 [Collybiopsis luxurians FD-317 M1]|uniref:Uncharacterized protein n=1 Tax=Collybiopsis luxurians FD-317 M1 TaxID=944289 RepID=A0A0D0CJF5_9AGAR|nr:hypothetical protein GYMLUDRAFT_697158 [Collybiopsis luxurians FD-317 M1]